VQAVGHFVLAIIMSSATSTTSPVVTTITGAFFVQNAASSCCAHALQPLPGMSSTLAMLLLTMCDFVMLHTAGHHVIDCCASPGGKNKHCARWVDHHTSHLRPHTSHLTPRTLHLILSQARRHTSRS
jgi:hypothetical protein